MNYDFSTSTDEAAAERFRTWLESETIDGLQRSYGDNESTRAIIFLFANRSYEAHMPEASIAETFGKCIIRVGYREEDERPAFDLRESLAGIARRVHGKT